MLMNTRSYGLTNLSLHHSDSVTAQNSLTFTKIFLLEYLYIFLVEFDPVMLSGTELWSNPLNFAGEMMAL